jgi:hypothetical protein
MTIGLIVFIAVHLLQVARAGWNNFRAMVTGYEIEPALRREPIDEPDADADVDAVAT